MPQRLAVGVRGQPVGFVPDVQASDRVAAEPSHAVPVGVSLVVGDAVLVCERPAGVVLVFHDERERRAGGIEPHGGRRPGGSRHYLQCQALEVRIVDKRRVQRSPDLEVHVVELLAGQRRGDVGDVVRADDVAALKRTVIEGDLIVPSAAKALELGGDLGARRGLECTVGVLVDAADREFLIGVYVDTPGRRLGSHALVLDDLPIRHTQADRGAAWPGGGVVEVAVVLDVDVPELLGEVLVAQLAVVDVDRVSEVLAGNRHVFQGCLVRLPVDGLVVLVDRAGEVVRQLAANDAPVLVSAANADVALTLDERHHGGSALGNAAGIEVCRGDGLVDARVDVDPVSVGGAIVPDRFDGVLDGAIPAELAVGPHGAVEFGPDYRGGCRSWGSDEILVGVEATGDNRYVWRGRDLVGDICCRGAELVPDRAGAPRYGQRLSGPNRLVQQ